MVVKWPTGQPANQPSSQSAKYTKISQVRSKIQPTSTKLGPKIHQVGSQNLSSWALKSTKLGSKIKKNQSWEDSGGVLGPSWPILAPKTRPRPKYTPKTNFWGPSWGPILEAKILPKSFLWGSKSC